MSVAVIELQEEELINVSPPFVLLGIFKQGSSPKLKAAYSRMADLRKQLSEVHKEIDSLIEYES